MISQHGTPSDAMIFNPVVSRSKTTNESRIYNLPSTRHYMTILLLEIRSISIWIHSPLLMFTNNFFNLS